MTAENRNSLMGQFRTDFINNFAGDFDNDELYARAEYYAKDLIGKEKAHFSAYLKGRSEYSFKGTRYIVKLLPHGEEEE